MNIRVLTERNVDQIARDIGEEVDALFFVAGTHEVVESHIHIGYLLEYKMHESYPGYAVIDVDTYKRGIKANLPDVRVTLHKG